MANFIWNQNHSRLINLDLVISITAPARLYPTPGPEDPPVIELKAWYGFGEEEAYCWLGDFPTEEQAWAWADSNIRNPIPQSKEL